MGILDLLENSPAFKGALGQLEAAVLPVVLSEVLGNGSQGGLNAIVAKLQQAGFGDQVKSWIGNGQNLPITAEQLQAGAGQRHRQATGRPVQYSGRPARQGAGAVAPQGRRSCEPERHASAYRLRRRRRRFRKGPGPICPDSAETAFIALKNLQNLRICHVPM